MILYFTGTGNSRYVAKRIGEIIKNEVKCINRHIKAGKTDPMHVCGNLVICTPTYSWRIPKLVEDWLTETPFVDVKNVWFVMTCGAEIGNAGKYLKELCKNKNLNYMGVAPIVMPENYIAMFKVPDKEKQKEIIEKANPKIDEIARLIRLEKKFPETRNNLYDKFVSGPVNPFFYSFCTNSKKFYAKNNCIGCGNCEQLCPLNNIKIINGRPKWGNNCTHCMSCISTCPETSIEYGRKTIGKERYYLP